MEKKNLLKLSAACAAAAVCTMVAGFGVYAATQNTLTATDTVAFTADPWVDATVSDGTTTFTFESTNTKDDAQTGTFANILEWTPVENSINETASLSITIKNTSTVEKNILTYAVENDWSKKITDNKVCTMVVSKSVDSDNLAKGESVVLTYTFTADGRYDFNVDLTWKVILTATNTK